MNGPKGVSLDQNCKKRLVEATTDALKKVSVTNGTYLFNPSTLHLFVIDSILPAQGKQRKKLESYIGEWPFSDFARESLTRFLNDTRAYISDDTPVPLFSLNGFEDVAALSERLVADFDSLPWTYDLTLVLPDAIGKFFLETLGPIRFGESIQLVALDSAHNSEYPLASGNENRDRAIAGGGFLGLMMRPAWPTAEAGLKIRINGFVGYYGVSEPVKEALSTIDSFFGICVALNLLTVSRKYHPSAPRVSMYFHKRREGAWEPLRKYDLDAAQSQTILDLALTQSVEKAPSELRQGNFLWVAERIRKIFADPEVARQIISAAKWLLNSYGTNDAMLAFVQATVALEILLGDNTANESIGLTELLRNRCAYLIAKDHKERQEIKDKFTEIYSVRSKIVHTGKSRLTMHESALLSELRMLGHRVIAREIELLTATNPGAKP